MILIIKTSDDLIKLEVIRLLTILFEKDPQLVLKASLNGVEFEEIVESIKDANPELALAAIEFWNKFLVQENISYSSDIRIK